MNAEERAATKRDSWNLIYISDGTSGSDKVARILNAVPYLFDDLEAAEAKLTAVEDELKAYDNGDGECDPEDAWQLYRDIRLVLGTTSMEAQA